MADISFRQALKGLEGMERHHCKHVLVEVRALCQCSVIVCLHLCTRNDFRKGGAVKVKWAAAFMFLIIIMYNRMASTL